ncbi:Metallo-dependent phosphatase-like protein [Roridomyces roridus]|uniref:Metallo-dependent phosphatase-like protein n=1 Tax=Roridomyces roridus TaxID=1738132 RepID=A0AAD7C215_9AGAR|nr:Metallo-dependent phosphatase-like protein [Roridomyces roridus]
MSAQTIHLDYVHLLPSPAEGTTRFVLLSDTHSATFPVPDGHVLLHAGDLTRRGNLRGLRRTMEYTLPHPIKMLMSIQFYEKERWLTLGRIIAGNRDFALHREWYDGNWEKLADDGRPAVWEPPDPISDLLTGPRAIAANVVYLQDQEYRFRVREGGREWSVFGSPGTPNFKDRIVPAIATFPATDILYALSPSLPLQILTKGSMTHGPPRGILDLTTGGGHAGCPALAARLPALRPRLHVFGHIHEARGTHVHQWQGAEGSRRQEETLFVNAANWPARHARQAAGGPGRQPIVVDLAG